MIKNLINRFQRWREQEKQEAELKKQHLLNYVSKQLNDAADQLKQHQGDYDEFKRQLDGYEIRDINGEVLQTEWSDADYITKDDIKETEGYKQLQQQASTSGLKVKIKEQVSEEYDDEERMIFSLDVSRKK